MFANYKVCLLVLLLISGSPFVYAQQSPQPGDSLGTPPLVKTFPDHFSLYAITQRKFYQLRWQTPEGLLAYEPNNSGYLGAGTYLLGLGFRFTVPVGGYFEKNPDRYGHTRFRDYDLRFFSRQWTVDANFQKIDGFYQHSLPDEDELGFDSLAVIRGNSRPLRPDMRLRAASFRLSYLISSPDARLAAAYNNIGQPVRSGGSFMFSALASLFQARGDTALVLPYDNINGYSLAFLPGYTHTFVDGRLYANLAIQLGPAAQLMGYRENDLLDTRFFFKPAFSLMLALGYDDGKSFATFRTHLAREHWQAGDLISLHQSGIFEFTLGKRFPEMGWMRRIRKSPVFEEIQKAD